MYVEGCARVCQAEVADQIAKRLSSCFEAGVGGIQSLNCCLDLPPQAGLIEAQQPSPAKHETTIDHYTINGGTVLCEHQLLQRIAQRHVVDMAHVEEDDVGPMVGLQTAKAIEAKDLRTALGRGAKHLLDG